MVYRVGDPDGEVVITGRQGGDGEGHGRGADRRRGPRHRLVDQQGVGGRPGCELGNNAGHTDRGLRGPVRNGRRGDLLHLRVEREGGRSGGWSRSSDVRTTHRHRIGRGDGQFADLHHDGVDPRLRARLDPLDAVHEDRVLVGPRHLREGDRHRRVVRFGQRRHVHCGRNVDDVDGHGRRFGSPAGCVPRLEGEGVGADGERRAIERSCPRAGEPQLEDHHAVLQQPAAARALGERREHPNLAGSGLHRRLRRGGRGDRGRQGGGGGLANGGSSLLGPHVAGPECDDRQAEDQRTEDHEGRGARSPSVRRHAVGVPHASSVRLRRSTPLRHRRWSSLSPEESRHHRWTTVRACS